MRPSDEYIMAAVLCSTKIIITDSQRQAFLSSAQAGVLWLFLDDVDDITLSHIIHVLDSPHSRIILSGVQKLGKIDKIAKQFKSSWVYYLPISFMKDGANYNAFYHSDLVMIGEKPQAVLLIARYY